MGVPPSGRRNPGKFDAAQSGKDQAPFPVQKVSPEQMAKALSDLGMNEGDETTQAYRFVVFQIAGQRPDSGRDALIIDHLPLVPAIARRIHKSAPFHTELDDLIHFGVMGLFDAASTFPNRDDTSFVAYAKHRIRSAIFDGLRQTRIGTLESSAQPQFTADNREDVSESDIQRDLRVVETSTDTRTPRVSGWVRKAEIIAHATEALDGQANAMDWLQRPNPGLGGKAPLNVLTHGDIDEVNRVDELLYGLEYGMYP